MKNEQLIIKNTAILATGRAIGMLSNLLFIIYFSRVFGAEVLGRYALGMSVGGVLAAFISLGLDVLLARDVSRDRAKNVIYIVNFFYIHALMAGAVWMAMLAWVWVSAYSEETKNTVLILGAYHILFRISLLFRAQFQAHENMMHMALLNLVVKFSVLILGVLAITLWSDPIIAVSVFPITGVLLLLVALSISKKYYGFHWIMVDIGFIKTSLLLSMPLFVIVFLTQVYERIGIILLANFAGETTAGLYAAPDRLVAVVQVGLFVYSNAIFPTLSRVLGDSKHEMVELARRALRFLLILLCPFVATLYVLSDQIIALVYGSEFKESAKLLRILSLSIVFDGLFVAVSQVLIVASQHKGVVRIQVIIYGLYILLGALLIYFFGAAGLAYAKVTVSAILVASILGYAMQCGIRLCINRTLLWGVLAAIVATALVEATGWSHDWVKVPLLVVIFGAVMLAVRELRWTDASEFVELIRRRREQ